MLARTLALTAAVASLCISLGCSATGAATTGLSVFQNTQSNKLDLRVFLDGQEAKRNEWRQAATGYSRWTIKEKVSTSPTLRFDFKKPDALGRIRSVNASIFQKFEADYSHQAEFTIFSTDSSPQGQLKPGTDYPLGAMPGGYSVMNFSGQNVGGVQLKPGMKYMLVLSVAADDSETAQVYFETR